MDKSEDWKVNKIKFKKLMRTQFRSENSRRFEPNRITYEEILKEKELKKKQNIKRIEIPMQRSPEKGDLYRMVMTNPAQA